ncbi:transposase [Paracoccus zhejiangensis]
MISGIIHVLHVGCRGQDCPPGYGPVTTTYNRFNRWSHRGIWGRFFVTLAAQTVLLDEPSIGFTAERSDRSTHCEKGGANSGHPALAQRPDSFRPVIAQLGPHPPLRP